MAAPMNMEAERLAFAYVFHHNEGVRSGDFGPLLNLFANTAELHFQNVNYGPFLGHKAIREAFRENPPSDELVVLDIVGNEHTATLTYGWRVQPTVPAGVLRLEVEERLIQRVTVG